RVASVRGRREPQDLRPVEVLEDGSIRLGGGVMRFVYDDGCEVLAAEALQSLPLEGLHASHDDIVCAEEAVRGGALLRFFDSAREPRVRLDRVLALREQLLAMREPQDSPRLEPALDDLRCGKG